MTSEEIVLTALRSLGRQDALTLRSRAVDMDGTSVIAEEAKVPAWSPGRDYSGWPVGGPVRYEGQVYKLLQPHNAAHYPGSTPANSPALWSITHTTDPMQAKPWAEPSGTSGMYMAGECVAWADGQVYRCLRDNTVHSPEALPEAWEAYDADGQLQNM